MGWADKAGGANSGGGGWGSGGGGFTVTGSSSGGGGGGGWFDSLTGSIGHALGTHGPLGGIESTVGNLGSQAWSTVHALPSIPGMAWHDIKSSNNVSLIDLIANHNSPWHRLGRQLHDPHGLIGSTYLGTASDVSHAAHGDWRYFQQNPLNAILDVATVASLGGAGALKLGAAGALGERAARVARAERVLTHTNEAGETLKLPLGQARTLQGRIRQQAFDNFSRANPDMRIVGLHHRTGIILNARAGVAMLRARLPVRKFQQVTEKLTPSEKFAFHVGAEGVPLDDRILFYNAELAMRPTRVLRNYVRQLESPEVRDALTNPRPELVDALHKGAALEAAAGERLVQTGTVSPESRVERAALPQELMGTTPTPGVNPVHPDFPAPFRFWHTTGSGGKTLEGSMMSPETSSMLGKQALGQAKHSTGALLQRGEFITDPERVLATDYLSTMRHETILAMQRNALMPISEAIAADLPGFKRPEEWYFRPSFDRNTTAPIGRSVRAETGIMQDRLPLDQQLHEKSLEAESKRVTSPDLADVLSPDEQRLVAEASDAEKAAVLDRLGVRRIAPAYGKDFQKSFQRTPAVIRKFVDRPLDVWRMITLNFRPAWAINNLAGNAVMGLAAYPGSAALYLKFLLAQEGGYSKFLKVWNWTKERPKLRRKWQGVFEEVAPELHSAGLFGTQTGVTHEGIHLNRGHTLEGPIPHYAKAVPRGAGRAVASVGRAITHFETTFAEDVGREAVFVKAAGADLAKIRETARLMGEGNIALDEALKRLTPEQVEKAVRAVNDALGNFNELGHTERAVLRRLIPFYSWYKVITKVSAKYIARYPARVKLLQTIAQAKKTTGEPQLPSWLGGSQLVGGAEPGFQRLISTQGLNPYETIPQTVNAPLGALNPFIAPAFIGATGRNPTFGTLQDYYGPGATSRGGTGGILERTAGSAFSQLAPIRLLLGETTPYQGKLYDPKTYRRNLLLQYLGLPVRDVNKAEARRERGL